MATPLMPDDPAELGGYHLAGRLGEGGQGVVYLAHSAAGEPVAIKLLSAGDRETRARLARELEALESIASFCTARVLDASTDGPRPYVISEFIDGPSLAERVRGRGPLTGGDLERVAVGTATALAAIHAAGVVHRDFKPANVLLGPDGPRVVDFGIARAEGAATMTSGLIGTPAYLAPEQINGAPASFASDVFAWAATVLFAATGTNPFGADTVPAVLHRVLHAQPDLGPLPPRLRGPIAAALAKDPSLRPTAGALMVQLVNPNATGPYAEHPPAGPGGQAGTGPTGPVGQALTTGPSRGRSRAMLAGVLAAVVALAGGGAALLWADGAPFSGPPGSGGTPTPSVVATTGEPTPARETPLAQETTPVQEPTPRVSTPAASSGHGDLRIPAAFAGTWEGTADGEVLDKTFEDDPVAITLKEDESTGTWHSPADTSCPTGTLLLTEVEKEKLTFRLTGLGGVCAFIESVGETRVTLELDGDDEVKYRLTMPMDGKSEGKLKRSG
ncbi:serine/threonine-protein kinase [Nonomuraea sp. NPDC049649]|uniref:serine/threonine-protein kinase n=1 Tax=Nonomuraea sp. NPDC049649 TaxID=3155776 RepID=UPI0034152392